MFLSPEPKNFKSANRKTYVSFISTLAQTLEKKCIHPTYTGSGLKRVLKKMCSNFDVQFRCIQKIFCLKLRLSLFN